MQRLTGWSVVVFITGIIFFMLIAGEGYACTLFDLPSVETRAQNVTVVAVATITGLVDTTGQPLVLPRGVEWFAVDPPFLRGTDITDQQYQYHEARIDSRLQVVVHSGPQRKRPS